MPYTTLGSVTLTDEWQSFSIPVIGTTIRLLQSIPLANNFAIGYVAQYFPSPLPGGLISPWRRFYSTGSELTILSMPIPRELEQEGIVTWSLFIKARQPYQLVQPWTVEAQAFYPSSSPSPSPIPLPSPTPTPTPLPSPTPIPPLL